MVIWKNNIAIANIMYSISSAFPNLGPCLIEKKNHQYVENDKECDIYFSSVYNGQKEESR